MPKSIPPGLKPEHVLLALKDLDEGFEHGFKRAVHYELVHDGRRYAPKAVVGVAFRHLSGEVLPPQEFSGGQATGQANAVLRDLGFSVVRRSVARLSSFQLRILHALCQSGDWMTRNEIGEAIRLRSGGVFERGYSKAMGAPKSEKPLAPDSLEALGLVEHKDSTRTAAELEYKITDAGREALAAHGSQPALLVDDARSHLVDEGYFDPQDQEDERKRVTREVAQRQGQPKFRSDLLDAYGGRCAITGCDVEGVLDAAHILAHKGTKSNHITNGLLLRTDIHTLFDLQLIGIDPETLQVVLADPLLGTSYEDLNGTEISVPESDELHPNQEALELRWNHFAGEE